ncbi:TPA: motility associated factor glycosyltransferase family protein [Campylobacter jejuni]|uniref:motility associated factor glycosyltransferase family protein n=2 Tax=Campylobacter jejuni TaxID=197 RepID=UPI000F8048C0|nr:motility associated factor glycosyltransferase family protein [Campylobacter jejuni]ECR1497087.1 motility associated factor glycosyltransferase family protein [Campylobacter jejuni]EDN5889856.1 motility associated factor glycosyltransferase family protein [Campylobacter jejuni]RTJ32193.1 PseD protein [Campylobacter jejuni]RTJ72075.1 PseD protein [Campylobacter jejuni]
MIFTSNQQEIFKQNINALNNEILRKKLQEIKNTKFKLVLGKDNLYINLRNTKDNTLLYANVIDELNFMLEIYNDKYLLYPVLYFYGFGNGILFKALLQNKHHQHIVIFEKDIEILWIMFHLLDFSYEIKKNKIIIFDTNEINIKDYEMLTFTKPFVSFLRIYFLELSSSYYEKMNKDIKKVNKNLMEYFTKAMIGYGNDPLDALQGIEQFVHNLPKMLTHSSYKELISKRKKLSKTAIIVSTGPSLTKQLPLLKQYANKATIFCADSAYPILAKHNIKPDYVCMLERTEITAEFFNHDFKDFDKDIVFICASLVHPNAIAYLEKNNREYILASRFLNFSLFIACHNYGYFDQSPSVAHMSYTIAADLDHENIIFIGQDLAYAKNGDSHPQEYQNSSTFESNMYEKIECLGYGGKNYVKTHSIWLFFKQIIEQFILKYPHINTYNCTEGGARIEGAIEQSFGSICNKLLLNNLNKPFTKLEKPNIQKQNEFMLKAYAKIYKSIKHCMKFKKHTLTIIEDIESSYTSLNYLSLEESKEILDILIRIIDNFKTELENANMTDFYEILGPLLMQFEFNLARIYVLNPKTPEDSFNKSVLWIKEHLEFMHMVCGHIEAQENALLKNIIPLEEKLKERGMKKYLKRIENASK